MSARSRVRPRTKVYDSNYAIGESYYKSAIDRLDRKYSGRPTSPAKQTSVPRDLVERHAEAFAEDDLTSARRRAEKSIVEDNVFDGIPTRSIVHRPASAVLNGEEEFDAEFLTSLKKIQERKMAIKKMDDIDMESTFNNISAHRMVSKTERMLDSVGLNESTARKMFEEDSVKRRAIKVTESKADMTKWTALKEDESSAAAQRAKQSRARLNDLEEEMEALSERQAAREKRLANLRALMAENAEESEALQVKAARVSARIEKKTVAF